MKELTVMKDTETYVKTFIRRTAVILVSAVMLIQMILLMACGGGSAASGKGFPEDPETLTKETAAYHMDAVDNPGPTSVGGDWLIKGLIESGADVPSSYYDLYYDNVRAAVKSKKGVLSEDHYTEYERVIIGLSAIGKSTVVEGYDLAPYLDDFDKVTAQGVNASCYALVAANTAGISLQNEEAYIEDILTGMNDERLKNDYSYADYLAIALEAMSYYQDRAEVKEFTDSALKQLSDLQQEDGSYGSCESTAECMVALGMLGIDPRTDERFVKGENSLADGLMVYYLGNGKFCHTLELKEADLMAGEKALLAADAVRALEKN